MIDLKSIKAILHGLGYLLLYILLLVIALPVFLVKALVVIARLLSDIIFDR